VRLGSWSQLIDLVALILFVCPQALSMAGEVVCGQWHIYGAVEIPIGLLTLGSAFGVLSLL
jgi:hypothetical protein